MPQKRRADVHAHQNGTLPTPGTGWDRLVQNGAPGLIPYRFRGLGEERTASYAGLTMPSTRKTPDQYKEQTQKLREATRTAIAELKRQQALKAAEIRAKHRRAAVLHARAQKKRDDHAKILVGVAAINLYQVSPNFQEFLDRKLAEFYANAPAKLEAARQGLSITVVKPKNDGEQT